MKIGLYVFRVAAFYIEMYVWLKRHFHFDAEKKGKN